MEELESLFTPAELDIFRSILKDAKKIKDDKKRAECVREVVSIREWVNDEYYVGPPGMSLYPYWKNKLIEMFDEKREVPVNEVIITGGIGCRPLKDRIPTSVGYLTYEELIEYDRNNVKYKVMSEGGPQDTKGVLIKGTVPTKVITFSDGSEMEFTCDHRVRAIRKGKIVWVRSEELKTGDTIIKTLNKAMFPDTHKYEEQVYFIGYMRGSDVSDNIYKLSYSETCSYLAGVFDGNAKFSETIKYKCGSVYQARRIQKLLSNVGIASRVNVSYQEVEIVEEISIREFYKIIPLVDDISRERVIRGALKYDEYDKDYYEVQVVNVVESYSLCGDVSVKNSPTYYCDGIINHNTGKSTFGCFCIVRKIYELSCYTNIPALFQLMPGTLISFMYFTISKTQAELTGYGQIKNIIDAIPYFKENFPRNDKLQSMLVFPENLLLFYGSSQLHSIGMNMIGSILDEANFFQNGAQNPNKSAIEYSKIAEMYASIVNRSKSRFKTHKRDASLSVLISSNTTSSSFVEKRIKEVDGEPNAIIINARVWDVKPKGTYSEETFWVFIGSDLLDPCVVEGLEDVYQFTDSLDMPRKQGTIEEIINSHPMIRDRFVEVPMDFKKQYQDNLMMSLQDISGLSVAPSGRLFSSRPLYKEACDGILKHPFYKSEIVISTHDSVAVKDYLLPNYRPLRRNKRRFIHIDQSTTNDSTGFASSYIESYRRDKDTGLFLPVVVTDLLLRINPPKPPRKIAISKVRDFIFYMRDMLELEIGYVSYDSFASAETLQVLSENGVPSGLLSVDRTDEQYLNLVNLFYEHRIKTYKYPPAERELFELIHFRGTRKVDHPIDGSKDVCDAWAGSVWNAIVHSKEEMPQVSIQGNSGPIIMGSSDEIMSERELLGDIYKEDGTKWEF